MTQQRNMTPSDAGHWEMVFGDLDPTGLARRAAASGLMLSDVLTNAIIDLEDRTGDEIDDAQYGGLLRHLRENSGDI